MSKLWGKLRAGRTLLGFYLSVNWIKTLYFNLKMFPFATARKIPVVIYGPVSFGSLTGKIIIKGEIEKGMIGFGQRFEVMHKAKGIAEFTLLGELIFNGPAHIGKDVCLYVGENARCEFGYMSTLGSDSKLICTNQISMGEWTGIAYETQLIDTHSHYTMDTKTGQRNPVSAPIILGSHNVIANRTSVMPGTRTPDYCMVASNSLCNKDYTSLGQNILIGGMPAKLLKENFSRDWEHEKPLLTRYKMIWRKG